MNKPMTPDAFLLSAFQRLVPHPFREPRLFSSETAERLCLEPDDTHSVSKYRVSAISMVLVLSPRGISEAFIKDYGHGFEDSVGATSVLVKAEEKNCCLEPFQCLNVCSQINLLVLSEFLDI